MNEHRGTPLGRFLKKRRLALGLERPGHLARLIRPGAPLDSLSKLGARIRNLEEEGVGDRNLLDGVVAALGVASHDLEAVLTEERRLRQEEAEERRRQWEEWVSEPVRPYLVLRRMPAIYFHRAAPAEVATLEEAQTWASGMARRERAEICLVFDRRLRVWFKASGEESSRSQATPDDPGVPFTRIGNKRILFAFDEASSGNKGAAGRVPNLSA